MGAARMCFPKCFDVGFVHDKSSGDFIGAGAAVVDPSSRPAGCLKGARIGRASLICQCYPLTASPGQWPVEGQRAASEVDPHHARALLLALELNHVALLAGDAVAIIEILRIGHDQPGTASVRRGGGQEACGVHEPAVRLEAEVAASRVDETRVVV